MLGNSMKMPEATLLSWPTL